MTTAPLDLAECRRIHEAMTKGLWREGSVETHHVFVPVPDGLGPERVLLRMNVHYPHGADARGIAHEHNTYGALLARIEALEAGLLEACDLAETVCAEVTAYTDRGNPRIIDDDEARGEIARLRALARP